MTALVRPFEVVIEQSAIDDLRRRLTATRWPERETVDDWAQGPPLGYMQALCRYWEKDYDMLLAQRVNAYPQFLTNVDGLDVHFLHVRSPHADAMPLIVTHGWPGSVVEYLDVIGSLTEPDDPADAFHAVVPSLPGYGWSGRPATRGWRVEKVADAWNEIMGRLGYDRYAAHGGDWGSVMSISMATRHPDRVLGVHVQVAVVPEVTTAIPAHDDPDLTDEERSALDSLRDWMTDGHGYVAMQRTRPQTIGYSLVDSPAGLCAWIAEKFWSWSDFDEHLEEVISKDQLLDNISAWWFTGTAASAARLSWESTGHSDFNPVEVPSGITIFPKEIMRPSRRWAERRFTDLRWYERPRRGGHFAAFERPDALVEQIRGFFRLVR